MFVLRIVFYAFRNLCVACASQLNIVELIYTFSKGLIKKARKQGEFTVVDKVS